MKPAHQPPTCPECGSLLSAVTFTCVRGQYCKAPGQPKNHISRLFTMIHDSRGAWLRIPKSQAAKVAVKYSRLSVEGRVFLYLSMKAGDSEAFLAEFKRSVGPIKVKHQIIRGRCSSLHELPSVKDPFAQESSVIRA